MKGTGNRFRLAVLAAAMVALNAPAVFDRTLAGGSMKIGFSMALTGAYAGNGKAALLATQMWAEDQNAKGGLLGRQVQLVYYDDQSNPSLVPGIYTSCSTSTKSTSSYPDTAPTSSARRCRS